MIPSKLTNFHFKKDGEGNETATLRSAFGLAETKPAIGRQFIMMGVSGNAIKTGFISVIEWEESKARCIFYTDNSTYRWEKIENEGDAAPE